MLKKFLTSNEAASYLGISEAELNELVAKDILPIYKIGGIYTRFKVDELESYRRKGVTLYSKKHLTNAGDTIKDFFYFNDFYIISSMLIIIILYIIFK